MIPVPFTIMPSVSFCCPHCHAYNQHTRANEHQVNILDHCAKCNAAYLIEYSDDMSKITVMIEESKHE
jgi:peptide subunit release factor 1 (eRF1)